MGIADKVEWQRRVKKYGNKVWAVNRDWTRIKDENKMIDLNECLAYDLLFIK